MFFDCLVICQRPAFSGNYWKEPENRRKGSQEGALTIVLRAVSHWVENWKI